MHNERQQEQSKSAHQLKIEKHWKEALDFDNDEFKNQTSVDVYAIRDFRPKMTMLLFWKNGSSEKRQRIVDFVKEYKETGISAFINMLEDDKVNEKILEIGKKSKPEDAKKVFSKIAEMAEWIRKISDQLAEAFFESEKGTDDQSRFADIQQAKVVALESVGKITGKVNKIIENFYNMVASEETDLNVRNIENFITDLENSKIQIDILSALLKTAKEQGIKLSPENIRDMKMETHEVGGLTGDAGKEFIKNYKKPVMEMMRKSYVKIFEENPDARVKVENNFRERFENLEKYRVYVLMFQGEAVAFSVIDPNNTKDCEEGEVMSESTVVHPDVQQGAMGIEFLRRIFEREFNEYKIKGIRGKVRAGHPAGESYDRIGLVVDKSRPTWVENDVEYESRVARKEQNGSGQETLNRQ